MSDNILVDHYRCPERFKVPVPFDLNDVISNLRFERYMREDKHDSTARRLVRRMYYAVRPFLGVAVRKHLQSAYLRGWQDITFPRWPVYRTVECIFESFV